MRRLGLAVAFGVLAAGATAQAQEAPAVTIGQVNATAGSSAYYSSVVEGLPDLIAGAGAGTAINPNGGGSNYNSYVTQTPSLITFESDNTGVGPYIETHSFSTVEIGVHNTTGQSIDFGSTITAAGFGFYLADTRGGCLYSQCNQIENNSQYTFSDLAGDGLAARVSFDFSVASRDLSGEETGLFGLHGDMYLTFDGQAYLFENVDSGEGSNFPGARNFLNFGGATGDDGDGMQDWFDSSGHGYAWDAKDFTVDLGEIQDQTLIYKTEVSTFSGTSCIDGTTVCLVAYSGFGDPVGRGGGIFSLAAARTFGIRTLADLDVAPCFTGRICGTNYTPQTFQVPTFQDGVLGFHPSTGGAVPEPATWMSLIFGFGLLGTALRRRRFFATA